MGCCCGKRTKTVRLLLRRRELEYDLANVGYIEGDVMKTENEHDRHQVQDIVEDGNIDRVTRMLDLAYAECVEALFPYTKREVDRRTFVHNLPTTRGVFSLGDAECFALSDKDGFVLIAEDVDDRDYVIELLVPDDYSKSTVMLLLRYIHEYMVCRAMEDWMSITNPPAAGKWEEKRKEMDASIREAVNFRTRRVRRTLTPW